MNSALLFFDKWLAIGKDMDSISRGWYLNLLIQQHRKSGLPNNIEELANFADVRFSEFEKFCEVWDKILKYKFTLNKNNCLESINKIFANNRKIIIRKDAPVEIKYSNISFNKKKHSDWFTPNCYSSDFKMPTELCGVYMIFIFYPDIRKKELVYIGSAGNLRKRYVSHPILRKLKGEYSVIFRFKECKNYSYQENRLIKFFKPKFNKRV